MHRRIQGGPGGHVPPPLDRLKCIIYLFIFCLRLWRRIGPATGDHEKFLILPPTEMRRLLETGNFWYYPPPTPLNRAGFWRQRKFLVSPPPPTESGRLLETKEISGLTPPPLNRAGFWRQGKFLLLPPPPSQLLCPS